MAAECVRSLICATGQEDDGEWIRMMVGAVLLADGLNELRNIRKLLTAPEK